MKRIIYHQKPTTLKILVVNENQRLLDVVSLTLTHAGHEVTSTDNPLEASELIYSKLPDLVVMDLLVSYLTCFELMAHIRSVSNKYIKIIVITKVNLDSIIEKAFQLGVDDYILLPLQKKELLARIKRLERYELAH